MYALHHRAKGGKTRASTIIDCDYFTVGVKNPSLFAALIAPLANSLSECVYKVVDF